MAGIINYYHGERGVVDDRWWQIFEYNICSNCARNSFSGAIEGRPTRRTSCRTVAKAD
jgi:hypothetical protein